MVSRSSTTGSRLPRFHVSGDPDIVLAAGVAPLVRAVRRVAEDGGVDVALVGGLAVASRLGVVHRATQDADLVADEAPAGFGAAHFVAGRIGVVASDDSRLIVGGTKVEIIGTDEVDDSRLAGLGSLDHLFVAAHRWALETAGPMRLAVEHTAALSVSVRVATPAAPVATKLHPLLGRRRPDPKRASDVYDLVRLLEAYFGAVVAAVAGAPYGLRGLVRDGVSHVLLTDADRAVRLMRTHGEGGWRGLDADDLRRLGSAFGERLSASA